MQEYTIFISMFYSACGLR